MMTTRQKLLTAFGVLSVLVLLACLLGLRTAGQSYEAFSRYVHGSAARMELANHVLDATNARALAARNLLLADTPARAAAARDAALKAHATVQDQLRQLRERAATAPDPKVQPLVEAIAAVEVRYSPVALDLLDRASRGDREGAIKRMNEHCAPLLAELLKAGETYLEYGAQRGREEIDRAAEAYATARGWLVAAVAAAVGTALALGWAMPRALMRSLGAEPQALGSAAQRIAQGDLSPVDGGVQAADGSVLASMAAMRASLARIVAQVRGGSEGVAGASIRIAQGNQDLSARTEQQASALQETASAMEELGATVAQNAEHAREADRLARSASTVAQQGGEAVAQVVQTMKGIDESSRRIADIIAVIDGIAFQTNILALNAAVEAARAGEEGRGFAVVAGEVRNLARRSADAAREINRLISDSVERVALGSGLVDQAGRTMQDVVAAVRRVSEIVGEISSASAEQSQGVAQVGQAVAQMDQATQQNAALVEQSAAAAAGLQQQARQLVEAVAVFTNAEAA